MRIVETGSKADEPRLSLSIVGGSLDRAIEELKCAVELTPDFATANARLAQAYQKMGDEDKFKFYCARAKELDPQNEVLEEIGIKNE